MEFFKNQKIEAQENDEEESLSFVDLPINNTQNETKHEKTKPNAEDLNFDFSLYSCSVSNEHEMCAADDVFFKGHILPYRHSISSDTGISLHPAQTPNYMLRSESMDHRPTRDMISSSRSSSINSQYSSSSGSGSVTGSISHTGSINRTKNYFHSHPSPSPRIQTGSRYVNQSNLNRRSNMWDIFRVGLVKTPEIELRELKNRSTNKNSRNNSRNSASSDYSSQNREYSYKSGNEKIKSNDTKKKNNRIFDFGGCKCSVNVVNAVNFGAIERGQKKNTSSRYRTFEWIKELSLECGPESLE